ncbi:MAG: terminase large subunit domain-containing protein, partial [Planctomycetota bacterium]
DRTAGNADVGVGGAGPARTMPGQARAFVPLLPYQRQDVESDDRFRWCCWARQTGKSFTKSLRRLLRGLQRGRMQVFLSAGERQSAELMQKVRQHCQALAIAHDYVGDRFFSGTSFRQLEIGLPGGVRIVGLPANPQTARGYTGDVLLDEFAMHAFDREIWAAMFPTILRGGGELDVASTPKGRKNVFYQLQSNEQFSQSVVTLPQAIEQGLALDLEEVRRSMGDEELFRQEFLCEFLDEATAFLTYEQIAACEDPGLKNSGAAGPVSELASWGEDLYAGVDVGRRKDLTVIWVLGRRGDELVTRAVYELANAPFRQQYTLLSEVLRLRRLRRCCIDASGLGMQLAESAVEDFGAHRVEAVTFTATVKESLAGGLRIAVEEGRIRIPVDERVRNDWHSVERSVTTGGHIRFEASRGAGSHADRFWAAALAVEAAGSGASGAIEWVGGRGLAFARQGVW